MTYREFATGVACALTAAAAFWLFMFAWFVLGVMFGIVRGPSWLQWLK